MEKYLAYVGIDFGTSGITFSYSFDSDIENKDFIQVKKWEGEGTANKTNTEIILDDNLKNIIAFGKSGCSQKINDGIKKSLHFSNIKMYLYQDREFIPASYSHDIYPLNIVISKFLEKMRDEAINELKMKKIIFQKFHREEIIEKIKWILTVPAIWSDKSKNCMLEAAKLAKLIKEGDDPSNFFALEPEAAACYYAMSGKSEKSVLDHPYIICDLGGGTADITTHERILDKDGKKIIAEIYPPTGGAFGSREINLFLEQLIKDILLTTEAQQKIEEILKTEGEDSEQLQNDLRGIKDEINIFKHTFSLEKINDKYKINLSALKDGYEEVPNLEKMVNDYNNKAKNGWRIEIKNKKKWILEFPYKILYDLFKELIVDKTSDCIKKIIGYLTISKKNPKEIKTIIFAGGMSSNISILEMFRQALPNISIVSIDEPEIAVAKGAILFAKNPYVISQRMARYSIGIKVVDDWLDKFDNIPGAQKIFMEKDNKYSCLNRFSVFYKKFHSINVLGKGKRREYDMFTNHCEITFYKSDYNGPVYVVGQLNEKGESITEEFGKLRFQVDEFDEKEPQILIEVKLGGTFITAEIEYLKKHKKSIHTFNFESKNKISKIKKEIIDVIFTISNQSFKEIISGDKTDKFIRLEEKLLEKHPEYIDKVDEIFYLVNGRKINRYKNLEENNIKKDDVIVLNFIEDDN